MLAIERWSRLKSRYAVRDDQGHPRDVGAGSIQETITRELDPEPCELRTDGRQRFLLMDAGSVLATANAGRRGRWTISAGDSVYELRRISAWRSAMELRRGEITLGSVRKSNAPRGQVICELPCELYPAAQILIGFLVLTIWNRAAASSSAGTVAATG